VAMTNFNIEWLNHNSMRSYPLADDATGIDVTGTFQLPKDFLVALDIPVSEAVVNSPDRFFLRNLGVYANGFSLVIGYESDSGAVNVASAQIPLDGHELNQVYSLGGLGDFSDTVGKVTIGSLQNIVEQPPGFYTFTFEQGKLDPDTIRPTLRGVSALVTVNGAQRSDPIVGDALLAAGENMRLTAISVSGQTPQIRFDAIAGEGLSDACQCTDDLANPVYTINGIPPNADGEFFLPPGICISLTEVTNGLKINNPCSQPCLSCTSLEELTRQLERMGSEQQSVKDFANQLQSSISSTLVILGSRLRDDGCITCE
jgi:hypothetical protein